MTRGIYTITNTKTGKTYVGQSSNIENRWGMHKYHLNKRDHCNYKLLKDWCKYGPEVFEFKVVEEVFVEDINEREDFWIDSFEGYVYNLVRGDHPTKKVPVVVDGIHEFDSFGSAASWYGVSTWCVRTGVRKRQEVDCDHSKHMFQKQEEQPNTLWEHQGFEVYSFEDIGYKMKNEMQYDTDDYGFDPNYEEGYDENSEAMWNQHGFSVVDAAEPSYDPEEDYIREELLEKTWEAAKECLTEEEYDLFHTHFGDNITQKSLAGGLDVTQSAISKKLQGLCEKVRKRVVNKKWEL